MNISLIVAMGKNREIGYQNKLLWHIPEDLKNFKKLTLNHFIIMGRKTFDSIGFALPKRRTIVLTRNANYQNPDVDVAHSIDEALEIVSKFQQISGAQEIDSSEVFVVGGEQIYQEFLPRTSKLYLSYVDYSSDADAFFPAIDDHLWNEILKKANAKTDRSPAWDFCVLERH
jgi:dihydrofolate reductase